MKYQETVNSLSRLLNAERGLGSGFPDKLRVRLYKEMRMLLAAGLDVKTVVELLMNEMKGREKAILALIDKELIKGRSLSSAMKSQEIFSNYEVFSIHIGEETGNLPAVLEQLEFFYQRNLQLKRQLVSALSYPAFVLFVAFGVVYFMLNNIVPMFADIFKRFGGDLPPLTKSLLSVSEAAGTWGPFILLAVIVAGILLYVNRKKTSVRARMAGFIIRIPLIGSTIRKIYLARFCQAMHLLTSARVPLTDAISMVGEMISFYQMETAMPVVKKKVTNGSALYKALSEFPIFESRLISMIRVAEEVNQLDSMFGELARQYNDEIDHQTKVVSTVLEPLIIIFIAGVVGVILVAMYLPLFKLSTSIG